MPFGGCPLSAFSVIKPGPGWWLVHLVSFTHGFVQFLRDGDSRIVQEFTHLVPIFIGADDRGDVDGNSNEFLIALPKYVSLVFAVFACQELNLAHYLVEVAENGDSIARDRI